MRDLICTLKKKGQAGTESSNILPKSSHARKKPPPHRQDQQTSLWSDRIKVCRHCEIRVSLRSSTSFSNCQYRHFRVISFLNQTKPNQQTTLLRKLHLGTKRTTNLSHEKVLTSDTLTPYQEEARLYQYLRTILHERGHEQSRDLKRGLRAPKMATA